MKKYYVSFETVTGSKHTFKVNTEEKDKILNYFTDIYLIPLKSNFIIELWTNTHDLFIKQYDDIVTI